MYSLPGSFFGLRRPSPLVFGLCGLVNGDLQEDLCQRGPSQTAAASSPIPVVSPCQPTPPRETLQQQQVLVQYPWSHCSFPLSLGAHRALFVPSKTGVSVSPGLRKSCNQILLAFKVRFSGDSQSLCRSLRLGSLTWDSEPSQQWENFFDIILWVTHFSGMGFDFIMIVPLYCLSAAAALSLDVGCLW